MKRHIDKPPRDVGGKPSGATLDAAGTLGAYIVSDRFALVTPNRTLSAYLRERDATPAHIHNFYELLQSSDGLAQSSDATVVDWVCWSRPARGSTSALAKGVA